MLDVTDSPVDTIRHMAYLQCLPRSLHVVAEIGVADALDDQPMSAEEIAAAVGADADALGRLLKLLSIYGVFSNIDGRFVHTPASLLLKSDHPQSERDHVRMMGLPGVWTELRELEYSVRTGEPCFERAVGTTFWEYLASDKKAGELFNGAMEAKSVRETPIIVNAYDFGKFDTIGDFGGGHGHLLQAIIKANPQTRGVLVDLPHVIDEIADMDRDRIELHPANFLNDELPSCDLYILMEVIHDWADAEAIRIVEAIRRSATSGSKLLVIERILPDTSEPHYAWLLDIVMMAQFAAKQRSLTEYRELFDAGGFRFERHIAPTADISILEAVAV